MTFVSRKEFAEQLGVSLPTVDRLVRVDGFPAVRLGRSVKILKEQAEMWLAERAGQEV